MIELQQGGSSMVERLPTPCPGPLPRTLACTPHSHLFDCAGGPPVSRTREKIRGPQEEDCAQGRQVGKDVGRPEPSLCGGVLAVLLRGLFWGYAWRALCIMVVFNFFCVPLVALCSCAMPITLCPSAFLQCRLEVWVPKSYAIPGNNPISHPPDERDFF